PRRRELLPPQGRAGPAPQAGLQKRFRAGLAWERSQLRTGGVKVRPRRGLSLFTGMLPPETTPLTISISFPLTGVIRRVFRGFRGLARRRGSSREKPQKTSQVEAGKAYYVGD